MSASTGRRALASKSFGRTATSANGRFPGCEPRARAQRASKNAKRMGASLVSQSQNRKLRFPCSNPPYAPTTYTRSDAMPSASTGTTAIPAEFIPGTTFDRSAIARPAGQASATQRTFRLQKSEDICYACRAHRVLAILRLQKTLLHRTVEHCEQRLPIFQRV